MSTDTIVLAGIIVAGFVTLFIFLKRSQQSESLMNIISLLHQGSKEDRKLLLSSLQKNTSDVNIRLDHAATVIAQVQRNLGEMNEIGRGMKEIQELLQSPKLRGNLGEHVLNELLTQMLPKQSFHLQYSFKSGQMVDAAIQTNNGIIPIDAKFPLESFRKFSNSENEKDRELIRKQFLNDVRKHIRDISAKYIMPDEGTIDYALMYIPSEAVYYEIANDPELFDYAGTHHVLPVSPVTFYAYMKAILMSFESQRIEKQAAQIVSALSAIRNDYAKVESSLSVLTRHITNSYNMLNMTLTQFGLLGQKIRQTTLSEK
jgi:DNA recombination protein RmuC